MAAKAIGVRVLLVSDDIQNVGTLCRFMEPMVMHVEVCTDIGSATRKLCHSKFEALDLKDSEKTLELVQKAREMTSHKGAMVLAILNSSNEIPEAFRAGANFALVKPLLPAS